MSIDWNKHENENVIVTIKWFNGNKMILNPHKFWTISLDKWNSNNTYVKVFIGSEEIQALSLVVILGLVINDQLEVNLHVGKIYLKFANKLNVLHFLGNEERKVFINTFVFSNFNHWSLVWMLENARSPHKTEALQIRSGKTSVGLWTGTVCIEVFQTIKDLIPEFKKNLFKVHKTNRA